MKNKVVLFLAALLVCSILSGCSSSARQVQAVVTDSTAADSSDVIDVDLTALSSTVVYAEVYNMVTAPEDYLGKTIKMRGQFSVYHDETTGSDYFAVVIADATACCQQGMEFVLGNNAVYPDDYPAKDSVITVQGVFGTYTEGEYKYCHLTDSKIVA